MMDKEIDELILYLLGGGRERTKLEAGILLLSRLRDENVELKNKIRDEPRPKTFCSACGWEDCNNPYHLP
jgi:hypothetical protein